MFSAGDKFVANVDLYLDGWNDEWNTETTTNYLDSIQKGSRLVCYSKIGKEVFLMKEGAKEVNDSKLKLFKEKDLCVFCESGKITNIKRK